MFYQRICNLKMPSFMGEMSDGLISHQSKSHQKYITRSGVPHPSLANITVLSLPGSQSLTSFSSSLLSIVSSVPFYITVLRYHNLISLNQCLLISTSSHTYTLDRYSFRTNNRY